MSPTGKSRPQTWWHWIDGNVSKEGIEADLKAMSENGYGAAIIFNISANCSNVMRSKTKPGPCSGMNWRPVTGKMTIYA